MNQRFAEKYILEKKIGEGAMGKVYLAYNLHTEQQVAIKILNLDQKDEEIRKRFLREVQILQRLQHPNIIKVYDYGTHQNKPYFTMDFIEGKSLQQRLAEGEISFKTKLQIFIKIAEAVAYAHKNQVVHRDLKPENVMINQYNHVYVMDFGIAADHSGESTKLTKTGTVMGTPSYMSPEQCRGNKVNFKSDIFSLGSIFYELLTGQLPFSGNLQKTMLKIANEDPTPPSELVAIPEALSDICMKALSKKKVDRYKNIDEFIVAVNKFVPQLQVDRLKRKSQIYKRRQEKNRSNHLYIGCVVTLLAIVLILISSYATYDKTRLELEKKITTLQRLLDKPFIDTLENSAQDFDKMDISSLRPLYENFKKLRLKLELKYYDCTQNSLPLSQEAKKKIAKTFFEYAQNEQSSRQRLTWVILRVIQNDFPQQMTKDMMSLLQKINRQDHDAQPHTFDVGYYKNRFYALKSVTMSWPRGLQIANSMGGSLVVVKDQNHQRFLSRFYHPAKGSFFIGLNYKNSKWTWVNGGELQQKNSFWLKGQPDLDLTKERYVSLMHPVWNRNSSPKEIGWNNHNGLSLLFIEWYINKK